MSVGGGGLEAPLPAVRGRSAALERPSIDAALTSDEFGRSADTDHEFEFAPIPLDVLPSEVVAGDFQFIRVVGKGSFGEVWKAKKRSTCDVFAIKVLDKNDVLAASEGLPRVLAEKKILQQIKHPFIVSMHYAFQSQTKLYLVLDYVPGGDLFQAMNVIPGRKVSEESMRIAVAEVLLALEHLHDHKITFRDLKMENVLVSVEGHMILTDFGMAKEAAGNHSKMESVVGTPAYMAPEIILEEPYGREVDFWALGVLAYELVVGKSPFEGADLMQTCLGILQKDLDYPVPIVPDTQSLIAGFLKRDPKERLGYESSAQIKDHPFFEGLDWVGVLELKLSTGIFPAGVATTSADFEGEGKAVDEAEEIFKKFTPYVALPQTASGDVHSRPSSVAGEAYSTVDGFDPAKYVKDQRRQAGGSSRSTPVTSPTQAGHRLPSAPTTMTPTSAPTTPLASSMLAPRPPDTKDGSKRRRPGRLLATSHQIGTTTLSVSTTAVTPLSPASPGRAAWTPKPQTKQTPTITRKRSSLVVPEDLMAAICEDSTQDSDSKTDTATGSPGPPVTAQRGGRLASTSYVRTIKRVEDVFGQISKLEDDAFAATAKDGLPSDGSEHRRHLEQAVGEALQDIFTENAVVRDLQVQERPSQGRPKPSLPSSRAQRGKGTFCGWQGMLRYMRIATSLGPSSLTVDSVGLDGSVDDSSRGHAAVAEQAEVIACIRFTLRASHRRQVYGIAPSGRDVTIAGEFHCAFQPSSSKISEAIATWDGIGLMLQLQR